MRPAICCGNNFGFGMYADQRDVRRYGDGMRTPAALIHWTSGPGAFSTDILRPHQAGGVSNSHCNA